MKKLVCILLAIIMVFSLCSCGSTSGKKAVVGQWKTVYGDTWTFHSDNTYGSNGGTWGYNKETDSFYYVSKAGLNISFNIKEEDGVRSFFVLDEKYYNVEDYSKIEARVDELMNLTVDEMKTYYDSETFVGTPRVMCLGVLGKNEEENKITFSRLSEDIMAIVTEYDERIKSKNEYFCIVVDNNSEEYVFDDKIAYIFVE